jgi:hypothetical protein
MDISLVVYIYIWYIYHGHAPESRALSTGK